MLNMQVSISDLGQDERYDISGEVASKGLSEESLKKLPCHVITDDKRDGCGESISCTICLQVLPVYQKQNHFPYSFPVFIFTASTFLH